MKGIDFLEEMAGVKGGCGVTRLPKTRKCSKSYGNSPRVLISGEGNDIL